MRELIVFVEPFPDVSASTRPYSEVEGTAVPGAPDRLFPSEDAIRREVKGLVTEHSVTQVTQQNVAQALDIDAGTVSKWVNLGLPWTIERIRGLWDYFQKGRYGQGSYRARWNSVECDVRELAGDTPKGVHAALMSEVATRPFVGVRADVPIVAGYLSSRTGHWCFFSARGKLDVNSPKFAEVSLPSMDPALPAWRARALAAGRGVPALLEPLSVRPFRVHFPWGYCESLVEARKEWYHHASIVDCPGVREGRHDKLEFAGTKAIVISGVPGAFLIWCPHCLALEHLGGRGPLELTAPGEGYALWGKGAANEWALIRRFNNEDAASAAATAIKVAAADSNLDATAMALPAGESPGRTGE